MTLRTDDGVGFDSDGDGAGIGIGAAALHIAHDIVSADREPAALVVIGDRNSRRHAFEHVAGDDRAGKGEFDEDRGFGDARAIVVGDRDVVAGIVAHRAEGAIGDAIIGDSDAAAAENVDAIAVLAVAAVIGSDALDAIADDERSVFAAIRRPDLDGVVADVVKMIAGDLEAFGIEREEPCLAEIAEALVDDAAGTFEQRQRRCLAFEECAGSKLRGPDNRRRQGERCARCRRPRGRRRRNLCPAM